MSRSVGLAGEGACCSHWRRPEPRGETRAHAPGTESRAGCPKDPSRAVHAGAEGVSVDARREVPSRLRSCVWGHRRVNVEPRSTEVGDPRVAGEPMGRRRAEGSECREIPLHAAQAMLAAPSRSLGLQLTRASHTAPTARSCPPPPRGNRADREAKPKGTRGIEPSRDDSNTDR